MIDVAWALLSFGIPGLIIVLILTGVLVPTYELERRVNALNAPPAEKPPFWDEAMAELDRLDGTTVPEIVEVPDGYYTQRVVVEPGQLQARWSSEAEFELGNPEPVYFRHEPCHIPKTRKEIRWVRPNQ